MPNNLATNLLPIVSNEKKIEVSLVDDQAVIKLSTWTENLGWCCQKTLTFDSEMIDDLHGLIASARYKLKGQKIETLDTVASANVLKFPSFS